MPHCDFSNRSDRERETAWATPVVLLLELQNADLFRGNQYSSPRILLFRRLGGTIRLVRVLHIRGRRQC